MANKDTQFTNRPDVYLDEETGGPENWTRVPMEGAPPETMPNFAPGSTEPTTAGGALASGGYEAAVPADPRLGMNPQGEWTQEKVRTMFPGMLPDATANLLDPAEQAKKEAGMPYDPNKKYNPKTNEYSTQYEGPDPRFAPAGYGRPQPKIRRQDLEREIFSMYGNPFTMNPYDEVVKSDAQLPQLFDYIFDGKVAWSDIGRLNKQQREVWEEAKKEHHARAYKQALSNQQRAENAYKWMMGNYEADLKMEEKQAEKLEKAEAARLAREGKGPTTKDLWDPESQSMTMHQYDHQTGRWVNTGQKTGVPGLEDKMPPDVRADWELIKAQGKKADSGMMMFALMNKDKDPQGSQKMMDQMFGNDPAERQALTKAYENYSRWHDAQGLKRTKEAEGKAQGAVQPSAMRSPEQHAMTLAYMISTKDPKTGPALAEFEKAFSGTKPDLVEKVRKLASKSRTLPITREDIAAISEMGTGIQGPAVGPGARPSPMTSTSDDLELEAARQQSRVISGAVSGVARALAPERGPVPLI